MPCQEAGRPQSQLGDRDASEPRRVQLEVAGLVGEVHEIYQDQLTANTEILEMKKNVARVVQATQRRRLPRVRLDMGGSGEPS